MGFNIIHELKHSGSKSVGGLKNFGKSIEGGSTKTISGISNYMLEKHGTKQSLAHIGKRTGMALIDPGSGYARVLENNGLLGENDAKDVGITIDIMYGAATLGTAPLANHFVSSSRRRAGKGERKRKHQKRRMRLQAQGKDTKRHPKGHI